MKSFSLLLYLLLILSFSISGQIYNRSFELAAEPNVPYITPPLGWAYKNYASIHTGPFEPNNTNSHNRKWEEIPSRGDGNFYLVLSTGDLGPGSDPLIKESYVTQRLYLPAWTLIKGVYFFGTCDYTPYYDFGTIELKPVPCDPNNPNDPNNPCDPNSPNYSGRLTTIELARCYVSDVNDFGSTGQWIPFSRNILPQEKGFYDLTLLVRDGTDKIVESYFAVDDLSICGPLTPLGDITQDCQVDLEDLSSFSREWLQICSIDPNDPNFIWDPNDPGYIDPSNLSDPNCMCADFTQDNIVDANDLYPLHDNWLINDI